jgi:two-component system, LytTR family, response regulator
MHPNSHTILIPEARGVSVIDINSIVRIEARSNYSKIFLSCGRTMLVTKVLKQMEEMLSGKGFARIHRSHLVNTNSILVYNFSSKTVILDNNEQISISRRKRTDMRKARKSIKV